MIAVIVVVIIAGIYLMNITTPTTSPAQSTTTQTGPPAPQTLVIEDPNWPIDNLNALYQLQEVPWPYFQAYTVYQTLVNTNVTQLFGEAKWGDFLPGLATDWTISPDGTTYTYNLRPGIKFSSGNTFNSYEVWTEMYVWYYFSGNTTTFLDGFDLFDVSHVNFGPTSIGLLNATGLENPTGATLAMMQDKSWPIYTNGPKQIIFHMKAPFLFLNGLLATYQGFLFDCQWALQNGGFGTPASFNTYFNDHPIPGTGPYMVTDVKLNSQVRFAKNPNYWGANLTQAEIAGIRYSTQETWTMWS